MSGWTWTVVVVAVAMWVLAAYLNVVYHRHDDERRCYLMPDGSILDFVGYSEAQCDHFAFTWWEQVSAE